MHRLARDRQRHTGTNPPGGWPAPSGRDWCRREHRSNALSSPRPGRGLDRDARVGSLCAGPDRGADQADGASPARRLSSPVATVPMRTRLLETVAAVSVVAWRCVAVPIGSVWHDWMVVVASYWMFVVWCGSRRPWPAVTLLVIAYLLLVHTCGQWPRSLELYTVIGR
jgi:hypothetical protein